MSDPRTMQIKHFIPELLATKISQHGTLDAVFGTRQAGVICHTVNLDSPAARKGLDLGDRLVAFEGVPIHDANQFTNLITLYPAGWPVELTLERDGTQRTIHVRLTALPYERTVKPQINPEDKPAEEKPAEEKPSNETPAEDKPAPEKPEEFPRDRLPKERLEPMRPKIDLSEPGKVRDKATNREMAEMILARWKAATRLPGTVPAKAVRIKSEIRRDGEPVGQQTLIATADGRVRAEYEIDGKRTIAIANASQNWLIASGKPAQEVSSAKLLLDPHFAQAAVLGSLLAEQPLVRWGELALDGSDKASSRLCYRLSATDPSSEQLFVWLSVFGSSGEPSIELVKSGVGIDDEEPIPSTLYSDFRPVGGLSIPHRRTLVRGLDERAEYEIMTSHCELLGEVSSEVFSPPTP